MPILELNYTEYMIIYLAPIIFSIIGICIGIPIGEWIQRRKNNGISTIQK